MRTITHSDLRNSSARILRDAEAGETMLVSNRGKTVAVIGPANSFPGDGPRLVQPATRSSLDGIRRHKRSTTSAQLLDELRGDR